MKKLEEDYTGYEFTYFTFQEYDKMLDLMLYNLWKETFISKDDIKQELIMFIMKLESKIINREENIDNVKGFIVHSLKMKTNNITKEFFEKMRKENNVSIDLIEEVISNEEDIEDYLVKKYYLESLFEYYQVLEEDRNLLLGIRDNDYRNERYLLLRWLKKRVTNFDKDKWKLEK